MVLVADTLLKFVNVQPRVSGSGYEIEFVMAITGESKTTISIEKTRAGLPCSVGYVLKNHGLADRFNYCFVVPGYKDDKPLNNADHQLSIIEILGRTDKEWAAEARRSKRGKASSSDDANWMGEERSEAL